MLPADQPIRYYRYSLASGWESQDAHVIAESSVALSVNGEVWLSFTCTPTNLEALGIGFLFNEAIIRQREEIAAVTVCKEGTLIDVWLTHPVEKPTQWQRTSGCTGGLTAHCPESNPLPLTDTQTLDPHILLDSMEQLLQAQELYRETGGVHCSAVFDGEKIQLRAEDIGRHNTLDKLAGRMLLENVHVQPVIVITTGRVSSEMLQKSAQLGAIAVVSRTSPTSMSVELADQLGIALVGYARRNQFLVYAHPERIGL